MLSEQEINITLRYLEALRDSSYRINKIGAWFATGALILAIAGLAVDSKIVSIIAFFVAVISIICGIASLIQIRWAIRIINKLGADLE